MCVRCCAFIGIHTKLVDESSYTLRNRAKETEEGESEVENGRAKKIVKEK